MHSNTRVCCLETVKCTAYISATRSLSPRHPYTYHLITLHMKPTYLPQLSSRSGKGTWWVTTGTEQCCHSGMKWRQELSIRVHCYVMLRGSLWRNDCWWWHSKSNISVQQQNRFTWCKLHNILEEPTPPFSLLPMRGKQVPQECWYSCTRTNGITSLKTFVLHG